MLTLQSPTARARFMHIFYYHFFIRIFGLKMVINKSPWSIKIFPKTVLLIKFSHSSYPFNQGLPLKAKRVIARTRTVLIEDLSISNLTLNHKTLIEAFLYDMFLKEFLEYFGKSHIPKVKLWPIPKYAVNSIKYMS